MTGAASGIGLAFATRFGRAGMRVVLADVEEPRLAEAARSVEKTGAETLSVVTDVSDAAAVERLRDETVTRFGPSTSSATTPVWPVATSTWRTGNG